MMIEGSVQKQMEEIYTLTNNDRCNGKYHKGIS